MYVSTETPFQPFNLSLEIQPNIGKNCCQFETLQAVKNEWKAAEGMSLPICHFLSQNCLLLLETFFSFPSWFVKVQVNDMT